MNFFRLIGLLYVIIGASANNLPAEDLRELLKASMQNTITLTAHVERQAEKMNEVLSKLVKVEEEILDLKRKVSESEYRLDEAMNDMATAKKGVWELHKEFTSSENDISKEIKVLSELQSKATKASEELTTRVETVEGQQTLTKNTSLELTTRMETFEDIAGTWPEGRYCILANGDCPPNFTKHQVYMKAISTYSAASSYIKEGKFGNSEIKCHGKCGQYPKWYAELHIISCCK